jgi:hypothetical protein
MSGGKSVSVPWPLSTFPGGNPQESAGRLINCYAEPLGDPQLPTGPSGMVWRRTPGLSQHAATAQTNYRGGLIVNNLAFEIFTNNCSTVDVNGTVVSLGSMPGTKKISIARNLRTGSNSPDVVAVDIDNGAYSLNGGGAPTSYNGGGNLPQPNSVCFQDGYFFFTIADGRCFASGINALTQNSQTFTTANAKADVTLLRGIAFGGLLWLFSTGHCEIMQDTAQSFPAFPYTRLVVSEYGLVQANAIAGWEVGFNELLWVAQDYGVYWASPGVTAQPTKVSPPDLDRLIEAQVRAGNTLEAGVYVIGGKKFWVLSSPSWTWEFNLSTKKWNEKWSFNAGVYGRWRGTCGHPAFGKWLVGDQQSGNILWVDVNNYTENGSPLLFRMESGPASNFPGQIRIARADFNFDMGVGINVGTFSMKVSGAAAGTGGVVRLTVDNTAQAKTNDICVITGVVGTTEANGTFPIRVVDATHIELLGVPFVHAYTSGGTALDITAPSNAQLPVCAIWCSKDGGFTWGNPLVRQIGPLAKAKRQRASVKSLGQSGPMGNRWRVDVTDPVYVGFLGSTQSSDPRDVGV